MPIARWIGYGGATNFQHNVLETLTWAAGLLARTKNITIFATTHTGVHNPVIAAKQLATLDQIGHGGMPLVGTPDKVVEELEKLHEIGCAGATLSFVDFAGEFPYFRDEVLPRLEAKGLREKY